MPKKKYRPVEHRRIRRKHPVIAGWTKPEFLPLAGASDRAINYYVQKKVIPKPPFHGPDTRYGRTHLLRVLGVLALQKHEELSLAEIKTRLLAMSDEDLEAYLEPIVTGAARSALGWAPATPPRAAAATEPTSAPAGATTAAGSPSPISSSPEARLLPHQSWMHIPILDGLELRVRSGASPLVQRLAHEIYLHCVGSTG